MRRFDACALCLNRAREPLACDEGHLFCKECAYADLCEYRHAVRASQGLTMHAVSQKKDIKKQKERLAALKKEAEAERMRAKESARQRVLLDFEKGQLGLAAAPSVSGTTGSDYNEGEAQMWLNLQFGLHRRFSVARGTKRKFAFDSSTVESLALEAEEAALRQIEREQAEALRDKLPDFWLPSLTPTYSSKGEPRSLGDVKLQTTCRGGTPTHPIA